eukprot:scaffold218269_cov39-Tisochrysis_lutea.AAC.1
MRRRPHAAQYRWSARVLLLCEYNLSAVTATERLRRRWGCARLAHGSSGVLYLYVARDARC